MIPFKNHSHSFSKMVSEPRKEKLILKDWCRSTPLFDTLRTLIKCSPKGPMNEILKFRLNITSCIDWQLDVYLLRSLEAKWNKSTLLKRQRRNWKCWYIAIHLKRVHKYEINSVISFFCHAIKKTGAIVALWPSNG